MKDRLSCEQVRNQLAAFNEGWLSRVESESIEEHLRTCKSCAEEAALDRALALKIGQLPSEAAPAVRWETPARVALRVRALQVFPVVVAAAVISVFALRGPQMEPSQRRPSTNAKLGVSRDEAFSQAHFTMATGDFGGDPNRAITLSITGEGGGRTQ